MRDERRAPAAGEPAPADEELVARVLAGERGAFAALVDRHHAGCARYARRMLGHREDAEDAVQETFMRAFRGLAGYDERRRFAAWLFRILVNRCRTLARRRWRGGRWVTDGAVVEAEAPPTERDAEIRDALQRALGPLEPRLREAFLLRYGEGLGYEEMAAITGAGVSALKMRVKRARDAVRPALAAALEG